MGKYLQYLKDQFNEGVAKGDAMREVEKEKEEKLKKKVKGIFKHDKERKS
jgi:hypothetical protein